ncbi:MAG: hypothetical protein ACKVT0_21195, partial [Planctomycetaceae bacterium]
MSDSSTSRPGDRDRRPNSITSSSPASDRFFRFCRMALKELRETMRDRRTIVTLIMMPILVYPLLSVVFQKFLLSSVKQSSQRVFHVGLKNEQELTILLNLLKRVNYPGRRTIYEYGETTESDQPAPTSANDDTAAPSAASTEPSNQGADLTAPDTRFIFYRTDPLDAAVENQEVDVGIRLEVKDRFRWQEKNYPMVDCHLVFSAQSINSQDAYD